MQEISTMQAGGSEIFKKHQLTIGLNLGDRWSFCCVLEEAGEVILEQKLPTTPEAMRRAFEKCHGVASPWRQERILRG